MWLTRRVLLRLPISRPFCSWSSRSRNGLSNASGRTADGDGEVRCSAGVRHDGGMSVGIPKGVTGRVPSSRGFKELFGGM